MMVREAINMSNLIVAKIRILEKDYENYRVIARERGVSFAQLVRSALEKKVLKPVRQNKTIII